MGTWRHAHLQFTDPSCPAIREAEALAMWAMSYAMGIRTSGSSPTDTRAALRGRKGCSARFAVDAHLTVQEVHGIPHETGCASASSAGLEKETRC